MTVLLVLLIWVAVSTLLVALWVAFRHFLGNREAEELVVVNQSRFTPTLHR